MSGSKSRGNQPKSTSELIDELRPDTDVDKAEMSLMPVNGTLRLTLMAKAWQDAGIDPTDPGNVDCYYYEDEGVVIVDPSGRFQHGE